MTREAGNSPEREGQHEENNKILKKKIHRRAWNERSCGAVYRHLCRCDKRDCRRRVAASLRPSWWNSASSRRLFALFYSLHMFCNELFSSVWSRYVHDNNDHLDVNNPNDDDYTKLFRKKCRLVMWGYKRGNSYNPQYSRLVVFPETIDLFGSFWKKQTRPSPTGRKCKPCEWLLWWNRPRCMRVRTKYL